MSTKRTVDGEPSSGARNEKTNKSDDTGSSARKKKKILEIFESDRKLFSSFSANDVVKFYENMQIGNSIQKYRSSVKQVLINRIKTFRVAKAEAPFDRRVTFIEWHPTNPNLLAVASKGGDIILWNCEESIEKAYTVKGIGAGGSVQAMKFDVTEPHRVYTVSIEGKFLFLNFHTKMAQQFLETSDFKKWYVSLGINWSTKTMVVGDNKGMLTILTTDGEVTGRVRIHKSSSRITHVEFSKREPWLLCTASNDRTIKLWDIRQLGEKNNNPIALHVIEHEKPLNAAYFSLTDGCRLLTTDQYDKIHVYRSPLWNLETEISHPHRQYQHLTPIRAYWHPLEDIIFIGRYPHIDFPGYSPGELRTIDFFDAATGDLLHQHSEPGFNGIAALNSFNVNGDVLATGTGTRILIWRPKHKTSDEVDVKNGEKNDDESEETLNSRSWTETRRNTVRKVTKSKDNGCSKKSNSKKAAF